MEPGETSVKPGGTSVEPAGTFTKAIFSHKNNQFFEILKTSVRYSGGIIVVKFLIIIIFYCFINFFYLASTKVPKTLSITHILLALGSIGLCIAWVVKNYSGFTLDNGTYHFLLMTLFIVFTSVGASAFRIFTFVSRPVAKVQYDSGGLFLIEIVL